MEEKAKKVKAVLGELGDGKTEGVDEASLMKLLEGDFDPEKFEELMKETYNDDFYQKEDEQWKTDRDVRSSLKEEEDGDLVVGQDGEDGDLYDDDDANDDNVGESTGDENVDEEEEWPEEEEYFEEEAPLETALEKKVKDKMKDELYKLDYEDIVAGMPTRFKYRQVEANSFGLSTEEILFARDSSLKQFVGLKRMAPYREDGEHFVGSKKRRRFREMLKRDLQETVRNQEEVDKVQKEQTELTKGDSKKRRRRKRGKKKKEDVTSGNTVATSETAAPPVNHDKDVREASEPKSKRSRRKKNSPENTTEETTSLVMTGDPVQKSKTSVATKDALEAPITVDSDSKKEKKKRKSDKPSKKKHGKKKTKWIDGVSESRLASYGL